MESSLPDEVRIPKAAPIVELQGVCKSYGGARAVRDLDLTIARGTVHAMVGENGAGKSTVGKIIAGITQQSSGRLLIDGVETSFHAPRQALASGIAMIAQERALGLGRSVLENALMGTEFRRGPLVDKRRLRARFDELAELTGFGLNPDVPVGTLSVADQQKVEIMRAVSRDANVIVMDEPTAPLTRLEATKLYEVIAQLRAGGTTVIYISHFLDEVLTVSDVVTVMRDGQHVTTTAAARQTVSSLVNAMLGRSMELAFPERRRTEPTHTPILEVRGATIDGHFEDVSFSLHPGEIVGIAGLIGSGRTELLRGIYGAEPLSRGEVLIDGNTCRFRGPRDAIANRMIMLPENRKDQGLMMVRSVAENMAMARIEGFSTGGVLRRGERRIAVAQMMSDLDVRARSQDMLVGALSGGNQQKVLLGKCLMVSPRVLMIDEPTQGVDVGAKRAIYELIVALAAAGMAVLMVSSELEEVLGLSHRVLVLARGRLVAEFDADEAEYEAVLSAAFATPDAR